MTQSLVAQVHQPCPAAALDGMDIVYLMCMPTHQIMSTLWNQRQVLIKVKPELLGHTKHPLLAPGFGKKRPAGSASVAGKTCRMSASCRAFAMRW